MIPVPGRFNAANALAAAATASLLDIDVATIARGIAAVAPVPGRFERIPSDAPVSVVVDYAHTPDGIATALAAGRALVAGRVLVVFGCGGDRDPSKRAAMGAAAGRGADRVVLTTDNPRSEDPAAIAAMAARGLDDSGADYSVELDRRAAIRAAIADAAPGDLVMVLGKGAETGQQIGETSVPFDDRVRRGRGAGVGMELTRAWVAEVTGGRPSDPVGIDATGFGIAFDSRTLRPGEVFVALRAERDGHEFVADAFARGAAFVIVERPTDAGPAVVVADVPDALLALARAGRDRLDRTRRGDHGVRRQDVDEGPHRGCGRGRAPDPRRARVVQQRDRGPGHGPRRPAGHGGARGGDGRTLRRQHRRAGRARRPGDRRHHQHRDQPRRAPRRTRGCGTGQGRAARRVAGARARGARRRLRRRPGAAGPDRSADRDRRDRTGSPTCGSVR